MSKRDEDDDAFRAQVELGAEFMTATYTFAGDQLTEYLDNFNDVEKLKDTLIGTQAILGFALNLIASLTSTHTGNVGDTILKTLNRIMLDFHQYDSEL